MKLVQLTLIGQAVMPVFVTGGVSGHTSRSNLDSHDGDYRSRGSDSLRRQRAGRGSCTTSHGQFSVQAHQSSPDIVTVRPR
jgi:hypothetical protein